MFEWVGSNSEWISASVSLILMVVWIIYLNLFFFNMIRTRRPMILVSRGVGTGSEARLFISNMGAEPIYVTALIADAETPDGSATAYITANDNISTEDVAATKATTEGPLGSGDYFDAGRFSDILSRVEAHANREIDATRIEKITLTVVAATGYSALISAGRKTYSVLRDDDSILFHPTAVSTEQLRRRSERRQIRKRLESSLSQELDDRREAEQRRSEDATA